MNLKTAMSVATVFVLAVLTFLAWLVAHFSEKWGNRIAILAFIALFQGTLTVLMMPDR
jgi:hypothetical protein